MRNQRPSPQSIIGLIPYARRVNVVYSERHYWCGLNVQFSCFDMYNRGVSFCITLPNRLRKFSSSGSLVVYILDLLSVLFFQLWSIMKAIFPLMVFRTKAEPVANVTHMLFGLLHVGNDVHFIGSNMGEGWGQTQHVTGHLFVVW